MSKGVLGGINPLLYLNPSFTFPLHRVLAVDTFVRLANHHPQSSQFDSQTNCTMLDYPPCARCSFPHWQEVVLSHKPTPNQRNGSLDAKAEAWGHLSSCLQWRGKYPSAFAKTDMVHGFVFVILSRGQLGVWGDIKCVCVEMEGLTHEKIRDEKRKSSPGGSGRVKASFRPLVSLGAMDWFQEVQEW